MAEQVGPLAAATAAVRDALAARQMAAVDADRMLAETLTGAHTATLAGINRLRVIAGQIEAGVAGFAVDTPLGAREFQKFLIARQREVLAVVAAARDLDEVSRGRLESLRAAYPDLPGRD